MKKITMRNLEESNSNDIFDFYWLGEDGEPSEASLYDDFMDEEFGRSTIEGVIMRENKYTKSGAFGERRAISDGEYIYSVNAFRHIVASGAFRKALDKK